MNDHPSPPSTKLPRAVTAALIVSLCLNCLFAGVLIAFLWHSYTQPSAPGSDQTMMGPRHGFGTGRGMGHGMGFGLSHSPLDPHLLAEVAPEKAPAIRTILDAHRGKLDALRQTALTARDDAARILTSESYTPEAYGRALSAVQMADTAMESEILAIVAQTSAVLTKEERQDVMRRRHTMAWDRRGQRP